MKNYKHHLRRLYEIYPPRAILCVYVHTFSTKKN